MWFFALFWLTNTSHKLQIRVWGRYEDISYRERAKLCCSWRQLDPFHIHTSACLRLVQRLADSSRRTALYITKQNWHQTIETIGHPRRGAEVQWSDGSPIVNLERIKLEREILNVALLVVSFLRKDDPSNLNHAVVLRFVYFYGLYGMTLRFENVNIVPPQNVLEMDTGL